MATNAPLMLTCNRSLKFLEKEVRQFTKRLKSLKLLAIIYKNQLSKLQVNSDKKTGSLKSRYTSFSAKKRTFSRTLSNFRIRESICRPYSNNTFRVNDLNSTLATTQHNLQQQQDINVQNTIKLDDMK